MSNVLWRQVYTFTSALPITDHMVVPSGVRTIWASGNARGDTNASFVTVNVRINQDSATNYRYLNRFMQNGAAIDTGAPGLASGAGHVSYVPAATSGSGGLFGTFDFTMAGWDAPHTGYLCYRSMGGFQDSNVSLQCYATGAYVGTSPYSTIAFLLSAGNFVVGSQIVLEGSG